MKIIAIIIMIILGLFAWSSCVLASRSDDVEEENTEDGTDSSLTERSNKNDK